MAADDPDQRRLACHPHAPGHDRSDAHRARRSPSYATRRRQAGPGQLDGGRRRRGRRRHLEPGRHPDLPVSRRRCAHLLSDVALRRQPARLYETPEQRRDARSSSRGARGRSSTLRGPSGARCSMSTSRRLFLEATESPPLRHWWRATRLRPSRRRATVGFPVALKLWSRTITHKTDVGGVKTRSARRRRPSARFRADQEPVSARRSGPRTSWA